MDMSDINHAVKIRKYRDSVFIEFTPEKSFMRSIFRSRYSSSAVNTMENFFMFLNSRAAQFGSLVMIAGLGLGLGLAWVVAGQPDVIQASAAGARSGTRIYPRELQIESLKRTFHIGDEDVNRPVIRVFNPENSLGEANPLVIADFSFTHDMAGILKLDLGDELEVLANNNGLYRYRVVETMVIESKDLQSVLDRQDEYLVLSTPMNQLRTKLYLVFARPSR